MDLSVMAIVWSVIANYLTYPGLATGQGLDKIVLTNQCNTECMVNRKVTLEVHDTPLTSSLTEMRG